MVESRLWRTSAQSSNRPDCFNLAERDRRLYPAAKTEIRDRKLRIFRVGTPISDDVCNTHDRRITHAMVDDTRDLQFSCRESLEEPADF